MRKKPLQIATVFLGLVPVITGVVTMMGIHDPLYASLELPESPLLDSNLRFFGGVWLALGLVAFTLIPSIEKQTAIFRLIWGAIFIGGIGRLISMVSVGLPPVPFIGFTVLEIVGAPLFIWWQHRVSLSYKHCNA